MHMNSKPPHLKPEKVSSAPVAYWTCLVTKKCVFHVVLKCKIPGVVIQSVSTSSCPSVPADEFNKQASKFLDLDKEKSQSDSVELSETPKESLLSTSILPMSPTEEPLVHGIEVTLKMPDVGMIEESHEDEGWQEAVPRGRLYGGVKRWISHKDNVHSGPAQNIKSEAQSPRPAYSGVKQHRQNGGILRESSNITLTKTAFQCSSKKGFQVHEGVASQIHNGATQVSAEQQPAGGKRNENLPTVVKTLPRKESESQEDMQSNSGTITSAMQVTESVSEKEDRGKSASAGAVVTQTATQTSHQILPGNFIDQGAGAGAGAVFLVRSVFSYKEIACAPPGTHSLMWPVLELPAVALAHAQQDSASPSSSSKAGSSVADQSRQDKKFTPQIVKEEESLPVPDEVAIKELSHIATQAEVISACSIQTATGPPHPH